MTIKQQNYRMIESTFDRLTPHKTNLRTQACTPVASKSDHFNLSYDQNLINDLQYMLQQGKHSEALSLLPDSSFLCELIKDHIEIGKLQAIMFTDVATFQYERISIECSDILGVQRETRIKTLYALKRDRNSNSLVVNQISNHLEDLLLDQFQTLTSYHTRPSEVFVQLYDKLNQIQHKFQLLKDNSAQLPAFVESRVSQILKNNKTLKAKIDVVELDARRCKNQATRAMNQSSFLKKELQSLKLSRHAFENEKVHLRKEFNQELQRKEEQFMNELEQLRKNKQIQYRISQFQHDLNFSIQELKDLILKLSQENKLLKEERELLLVKLSRVYEKFHIFVGFCQSSSHSGQQEAVIIPHLEQQADSSPLQSSNINNLKQKLAELKQEITTKNETIQKITDELDQLRKQRNTSSNLDRSMSGSSSEEMKKQRKYKRTKMDDLATTKITELEELRAKDKETIENLQQAIVQLNQKFKIQTDLQDDSQNRCKASSFDNTTVSQAVEHQSHEMRLNLSKIKEYQDNEEVAKNLERMTRKLQWLEVTLEQERHTNASLSTMLDDLHDFEKKKEETPILTPRMLADISQLKDKMTELTEKCAHLENSLLRSQSEKNELIKKHEEQIIDMEYKLSEGQLSLMTIENKLEQLQQETAKKQKTENSKRRENIENIEKIEKQLKTATLQIEQLRNEKMKLEELLKAKEDSGMSLYNQLQILRKQFQEVALRLKSAQTTLDYTRQRAQTAEKKYKSLSISKEFKQQHPNELQTALFHGYLLEDRPFEKLFLIETLQKRIKRPIYRTRMLWKLDPLNKTNFHQYIDNHQHFVVLIELENDFVIGAYSQGKIYPKMISDKDGIIISLTKKEVFEPIQPNRRAVSYDDYYLIFGNSEVRVRTQQTKFFSNFGLSSACYKARGLKVDIMTNSNDREVPLKNIEIHKLEFI